MRKELQSRRYLIMAFAALAFCWFFGVFSLILSVIVIKHFYKQSKNLKKIRDRIWTMRIAWMALFLSSCFTLYYLLALFTGGYIRWF